ncbi:MAG: MATE family efflux transporter [Ruminococcus sp.]
MHTAKKQYEMDMCSGSILKKMLLFTLPLMLSSILQLLFNAADIVVVGKFAGDNALAAVGSNTALINLLTNLFVGFSIGANVTAARHYGAKCEKDLEETVHTSIAMSFASGFLLMIVGLIGAKQFLIWMQTPEEVLPLATLYLHIYFIGMIPNMVYNFGSALLRSVGDTRRPLYYLTFAGCVNVVLNLLTVIVLHLDVAGVAIATVISETISAVLVLRCMCRNRGNALAVEQTVDSPWKDAANHENRDSSRVSGRCICSFQCCHSIVCQSVWKYCGSRKFSCCKY